MKITAIKQQVKRNDRYSIYVDGKYSFSLSEGDLIKSGLRKNQEVNEAELDHFKDDSRLGKLYEKTLNLLSYRQRSEWELRDYLRRKKQDDNDIEKTLSKLSENGYVDDRRFAKSWVETRRLLKPMSQKRLRLELRQKRIADDIIDEILAEDETNELDVLKEIIERKAKRYPDKQKLMQYLARQGFSYDNIKSALAEQD